MRTAICPKCEAPGLEWSESPLGVRFLRDRSTGAEHWTTCSGVAAAREVLAPIAVAAPIVAPVAAPSAPGVDAEGYALDYAETVAAELEYSEAMNAVTVREQVASCDWPDLRRQILAYGGIGSSPDFPRDWIPADLYRINGKAPDLVAAEAVAGAPWGDTGDDSAMLDYLHRSWEQWQRAQEARRPRARKVPTVAPAAALAAPAPIASERALVYDMARLVADVADLVAVAASDEERRRFAGMARAAAELARMVGQ